MGLAQSAHEREAGVPLPERWRNARLTCAHVYHPLAACPTCRNERSQHQNRGLAQTLLKSRLLALRRAEELGERKKGEKVEIAWGNQVRSYILHPYQMVKDLRSGYETGQVDAVLDGDLAPVMRSVLTLPDDG